MFEGLINPILLGMQHELVAENRKAYNHLFLIDMDRRNPSLPLAPFQDTEIHIYYRATNSLPLSIRSKRKS